jgi:hypothetical protein
MPGVRLAIGQIVDRIEPAVEQDVERNVQREEPPEQGAVEASGEDQRAKGHVDERHVVAELDEGRPARNDAGDGESMPFGAADVQSSLLESVVPAIADPNHRRRSLVSDEAKLAPDQVEQPGHGDLPGVCGNEHQQGTGKAR